MEKVLDQLWDLPDYDFKCCLVTIDRNREKSIHLDKFFYQLPNVWSGLAILQGLRSISIYYFYFHLVCWPN